MNLRIRHSRVAGVRPSFGRIALAGRRIALAGRWIALASFLICSDANPALAATPKTTWFGDLRERVILSPALESAMAKYVSAALEGRVPPKDAARLIADTKRAPRIVFLSLGDERGPARVFLATGPALQAALDA